jgi:hypothetical protein
VGRSPVALGYAELGADLRLVEDPPGDRVGLGLSEGFADARL